MDLSLSHEDASELLGAFALDAVDPSEATAITAHLIDCPRCRDEVARHQQTAAMLANTAGEAPGALWDGIAAHLNGPTARESMYRLHNGARGMEPRRQDRARRRAAVRVAALAGAAAVVAFAVLGVQVRRLDHRVNTVADGSAGQMLSAAARNALLDPAAKRIVLASTDISQQPAAEVIALGSGAAYLVNERLPALPPADTYQLWALIDGQAISVGVLGTDPRTVAFTLNPANATDAFAVTVEPASGSIAPTRPPVASTTI